MAQTQMQDTPTNTLSPPPPPPPNTHTQKHVSCLYSVVKTSAHLIIDYDPREVQWKNRKTYDIPNAIVRQYLRPGPWSKGEIPLCVVASQTMEVLPPCLIFQLLPLYTNTHPVQLAFP